MANSGRFGLSLRILAHLALAPERPHTSASIAQSLGTHPVMVRRLFVSLAKAGFLIQQKGPNGGARLKSSSRALGLGDIYAAVTEEWISTGDKAVDALGQRVRKDAIAAMNETTVATLVKKLKKSLPAVTGS